MTLSTLEFENMTTLEKQWYITKRGAKGLLYVPLFPFVVIMVLLAVFADFMEGK